MFTITNETLLQSFHASKKNGGMKGSGHFVLVTIGLKGNKNGYIRILLPEYLLHLSIISYVGIHVGMYLYIREEHQCQLINQITSGSIRTYIGTYVPVSFISVVDPELRHFGKQDPDPELRHFDKQDLDPYLNAYP